MHRSRDKGALGGEGPAGIGGPSPRLPYLSELSTVQPAFFDRQIINAGRIMLECRSITP